MKSSAPTFSITSTGEAFLKLHVRKNNTFMLYIAVLYLFLCFVMMVARIHPLDKSAIIFCVVIYLLMTGLVFRGFHAKNVVLSSIVTSMVCDQERIEVKTSGSFTVPERSIALDLSGFEFSKGIAHKGKRIDIHDLPSTYVLKEINTKSPVKLYFISAHWENWEAIQSHLQKFASPQNLQSPS